MSYETPRASDGARLCAWCGGEVKQAGVGRVREYCKQSCRELAYRERKAQTRIAEAVAAAVAPLVSSTDDRPISSTDNQVARPKSSVDEMRGAQANPAIPGPAIAPDPPAAAPVVTPAATAPLPRPTRRRSAITASPMPFSVQSMEPVADDGLFEMPPWPAKKDIEGELDRRVAWMQGLEPESPGE